MEINNTPDSMTSSSVVLQKLKEKGIDKEFLYNGAGLCIENGRSYMPEELEIAKIFRFEGVSDPSDMEVIYVMKSQDGRIGYFHDAYGLYASQEGMEGRDNFIRQVREAGHEEQIIFEL